MAIATVCVLPVYVVFSILSRLTDSDGSLAACSQFLSLLPGVSGSYLRNGFYKLTLTHCEAGVVISFGSIFSHVDTEIAQGVYIGPQCNIGSCKIARDCLIGSGVHILSGKRQHNFRDTEKPLREQGGSIEKITIGEDCWIGNGAIIMVNVGRKCIVGAGSVVTEPLSEGSVVAGNPAVLLKRRTIPGPAAGPG